MTKRSPAREQFLSDVLVTAIEHAGYGFPGIVEYKPEPDDKPADSYAVIHNRYEESSETWKVDIDTIAKGFGVIRKTYRGQPDTAGWLRDVILADRTNGDDGDIDVVGALLVLECAIFGKATYA